MSIWERDQSMLELLITYHLGEVICYTLLGLGAFGVTVKYTPILAHKLTDKELRTQKQLEKEQKEFEEIYPVPMNLNDFINRLKELKEIGNISKSEYRYLTNLFTNKKEYNNLVKAINQGDKKEFYYKSLTTTKAKLVFNSFYSEFKNRDQLLREKTVPSIIESFFNDDSTIFFGIIGLNFSTYVRKDNYGNSLKFCHRSHNEFCDNCTFLLTDIDFNNHKEEYYTLIQFDEKINELKKDLNEYIETNKNPDKEVVSLMESKITEGYKAGYSILDQIKGISSIESEQKNSEKTIELFEKTHMTNFDY